MSKSITILLWLSLGLSSSILAQGEKPTPTPTSKPTPKVASKPLELKQDKEALAMFHRFSQTVYRPCAAGLREVRFEVSVEQVDTSRPKVEQVSKSGPFLFHWKDNVVAVSDLDGKPVPFSPGLKMRIIADAVGIDPGALTKKHHVRLDGKNAVRFVVPDGADPKSPVRSTLFTADEKGRLANQALCDAQGRILFALSYQYRARGDQWLVKSSAATGLKNSTRNIEHVHLKEWTVPTRVVVASGKVKQIFRFRAWKFGAPAKAKSPLQSNSQPTKKPTNKPKALPGSKPKSQPAEN